MLERAKRVVGAALLALGIAGATGSADAQTLASLPRSSTPVATLGDAKPLPAWIEFCRREPAECAVDASEPSTVQLTARTWQAIQAVNARVNRSLAPLTDEAHWGLADRWDLPKDGAGDCEDFQLLKRQLLVREGLPRRAMRMAVVVDGRGDGHAVLVIRTSRGDMVLDNKADAVTPWFETGYLFVKRESEDRVGWVSLGRVTSPTATANW